MKEFYYQFKIRETFSDGESMWGKSIMKGLIEAEDSKQARKYICENIVCKDKKELKEQDILLTILEVTPQRSYLKDFFKPHVCKQCGTTFINGMTEFYSTEFCSKNCWDLYNYNNFDFDAYVSKRENYLLSCTDCNPVIYRIYNKKNGKNYVGQTIRSFTLRWWEHYNAWIKFDDCDITNFEFSVLEEFDKQQVKEDPKLLSKREQYWIDHYNAIHEGYNTLIANKDYRRKSLFELGPDKKD